MHKNERMKANAPVLLDFDALLMLLVFAQDVLFAHADLEAAPEPTALAEAPVRRVHAALLLVRALEVLLQQHVHTLRLCLCLCLCLCAMDRATALALALALAIRVGVGTGVGTGTGTGRQLRERNHVREPSEERVRLRVALLLFVRETRHLIGFAEATNYSNYSNGVPLITESMFQIDDRRA